MLAANNSCPKSVAIGQLCCGAFFFAMRSCEYLSVLGRERRTKLLLLRNIRFFLSHREVPHSSVDVARCDCVVITFEFQKNDERDITVSQHRTADSVLCPVKAWASLVQRILSYPGSGPLTPVNVYLDSRQGGPMVCQLSSMDVLTAIRVVVATIGRDKLGFGPEDVGTHSNRSAAAMAMYLAGEPVHKIMLIGRWSSDAFLLYIRRQVEQFSTGVSQRMVQSPDFFTFESALRHIPTTTDPRTSSTQANFSGRGQQVGGHSAQSRARQPAFALNY